MAGKITKRTIEGLKAGQTAWDGELKGFGIRARSDGKSYVLKYRVGTGRGARQRWFTIGKHGAPWTPESARKEADNLLHRVRQGEDPAAAREQERAAETISDLWAVYRERHALPSNKPRTIAEDDAIARDYILPAFGLQKVHTLTRQDVARWHARLSNKPYRANRALGLLRSMFNRAEAWGVVPEHFNPCTRITKFPERSRERYLNADELARLGAALLDFEHRNACPPEAVAVIRALLFTGARLSEMLTLRWDWVDFERAVIRLPDSKTGAKTFPLPAPAQEVLAAQPRRADCPLVFPGQREGRPIQGLQNIWQRIRKAAQLEDVRLHDLRHGFASIAVQAGDSLYLVGRVLGHKQASTTERYAHLSVDPVRAVSERAAGHIAAALNGRGKAEVVRLREGSGRA